MSDCGNMCNPCPSDLYPIIQDLSEVELLGNCYACSDTFGTFELQSLALPVMKPVQIMSPSPKQTLRKQVQEEDNYHPQQLELQQSRQEEYQEQQEQSEMQQQQQEQQEPQHPLQEQQQQQQQPQEILQEEQEDLEQLLPPAHLIHHHIRNESYSSNDFSATNTTANFSSYTSTSASTMGTSTACSRTSPASSSRNSLHHRIRSVGSIGSGIFNRKSMQHRRSSSLFVQNKKMDHRRSSSLGSHTSITVALDDLQSTIGSLDGSGEKPKFHDLYVLTRQIFRCRISDIWECIHKQSGIRYCVKIYDKRALSYQEEIIMKNEIDMLVRFKHCYNTLLVPLEGLNLLTELRDESNHAYLVMEYIPGGNLFSRIVQDKQNNKKINDASAAGEQSSSTSVTLAADKAEGAAAERKGCSSWTEDRVKRLCHSILQGVSSLHALGICHGDLQPQNILLNSNESAKIVDFGCALVVRGDCDVTNVDGEDNNGCVMDNKCKDKIGNKHTERNDSFDHNDEDSADKDGDNHGDFHDDEEEEEMIHHRMATIRFGQAAYTAPEILQGLNYDTQADMWSLGIILYFCFSGTTPFVIQDAETGSKKISYKRIYRADYSFTPKSQWSHVSRLAKQFISNLLHSDPQVRMTAEEALQHRWLMELRPEDDDDEEKDLQSNDNSKKSQQGRQRLLRRAHNVFLGKRINKFFGKSSSGGGCSAASSEYPPDDNSLLRSFSFASSSAGTLEHNMAMDKTTTTTTRRKTCPSYVAA